LERIASLGAREKLGRQYESAVLVFVVYIGDPVFAFRPPQRVPGRHLGFAWRLHLEGAASDIGRIVGIGIVGVVMGVVAGFHGKPVTIAGSTNQRDHDLVIVPDFWVLNLRAVLLPFHVETVDLWILPCIS
jgi:hypothetical protein